MASVEDDGPGIPAALAEEPCEPFRRGAYEGGAGWGLGLSLVAWAVNRLGGRVEVDRSPRLRGARLRLFLPRARRLGHLFPSTASSTESSSESTSPGIVGGRVSDDSPLRGVLVALVEDDHQARNIQTRLLQRSGAGVMTVEVDLHLGELNGTDVLEELRKLAPELASHTIFLSGVIHGTEKLGAPCLSKSQAWPTLLAEMGQTLQRLGFSCNETQRNPPS